MTAEQQTLVDWLRGAGKVTVIDEGEQHQLFAPEPARMYRLYNSAGDSRQIDAATAHAYGLKPTERKPTTKGNYIDESLSTSKQGEYSS